MGATSLNASLKHVSERQVAYMNVSRLKLHSCKPSSGGICDDVAVAEHGAFRVSGSAAGEAYGGKHVRAGAMKSVGR
jgi:hypothetical protein